MEDSARRYTVFALMLATFLTAVDATIVDTTMARIVGSLGGFSLFTWLVTAYLLTSTATVPVYGKLADLFGRKRIFTFGAILFVLGSALCGLSQSMTQLIIFRAFQGLGAGAVQPVVQTIIGDIFTPAERAKMQGWFSGVWGFSALVGPLVGGAIVDHMSWRMIFYINLPLGVLALFMVGRYLHEVVERRDVKVDYLGSVTMTAGLTALLLALQLGGTDYAWDSPLILTLVVAAAALLAAFIWQEGRAPDPMLPLPIFKIPVIGIANLASFMLGGVMLGTSVYLPLWAQGVQGYSATRSGASLLWLSIGWPVASIIGGRLILRMGTRISALTGLALNMLAAGGMVIMGRMMTNIPEVMLALTTFVIGSGMGFSTLAFVLGVQASVDWNQRGVATASLQFLRTLGGAVWVSVMGEAMNLAFFHGLRGLPGMAAVTIEKAGAVANQLFDPAQRGALSAASLTQLEDLLAGALRGVHLLVLFCAVAAFAITLALPNMRFDKEKAGQHPDNSAVAGH